MLREYVVKNYSYIEINNQEKEKGKERGKLLNKCMYLVNANCREMHACTTIALL